MPSNKLRQNQLSLFEEVEQQEENNQKEITQKKEEVFSIQKDTTLKTQGVIDLNQAIVERQKGEYAEVQELKDFLNLLRGRKFKLDCGHKVTFGSFLGNDITIRNSNKEFKIICSQCGY